MRRNREHMPSLEKIPRLLLRCENVAPVLPNPDFLRETKNPDFYEKFFNFYTLAAKSKPF